MKRNKIKPRQSIEDALKIKVKPRQSIEDILIRRDGMTKAQAEERIDSTIDALWEALGTEDYRLEDLADIMMYDLGLESDYLEDIL